MNLRTHVPQLCPPLFHLSLLLLPTPRKFWNIFPILYYFAHIPNFPNILSIYFQHYANLSEIFQYVSLKVNSSSKRKGYHKLNMNPSISSNIQCSDFLDYDIFFFHLAYQICIQRSYTWLWSLFQSANFPSLFSFFLLFVHWRPQVICPEEWTSSWFCR